MKIKYPFFSQIEIINCTFELRGEVINKNIDHLGKWIGEVYSRHGGYFGSYWYQQRSSPCTIKKIKINYWRRVYFSIHLF